MSLALITYKCMVLIESAVNAGQVYKVRVGLLGLLPIVSIFVGVAYENNLKTIATC